MLKVILFRPLHPLPLDRRSSSRPVSTEIPRSWSALSRVKPQIMVTYWKWGSPPASTTLSYPFANSIVFTPPLVKRVVFLKLELHESPLSPLRLPSGQTPDFCDNVQFYAKSQNCEITENRDSNVTKLCSNVTKLWRYTRKVG